MLALFCGVKARAVRLIFSNAWFSSAAKLPEPSLPPGILFRQMRRYTTQNNKRLEWPVIQRLLAVLSRENARASGEGSRPVSFGLPLTFDLRGYSYL